MYTAFVSCGVVSPASQLTSVKAEAGEGPLAYLVRVAVQVEVLQEAGGEFAEERVVRLVDGSQAPVGVVVGAGARAERTHWMRTEGECGQYQR